MVKELIDAAKPKMDAAIAHFQEELKTIRTGRASASLVEGVSVPAYGSRMNLKELATFTIPESNQILISPFDVTMIPAIRTAIQDAIGISASDDGRSLRVILPSLTTERRQEFVKQAGKMAEAAKIVLRQVRGDAWEAIQKIQKEGLVSEDNRDWGRAELDKIIGTYNDKVAALAKEKEVELLTV